VEREAHLPGGNYAYYHKPHGEWHPVAPPPPILPGQHVRHPAVVVHPAPATTEASNVFHYTINYQVRHALEVEGSML
jgi:hypothetical protein